MCANMKVRTRDVHPNSSYPTTCPYNYMGDLGGHLDMLNRAVIVALIFLTVITGCSNQGQSQFDEEGNYLRSEEMRASWCDYNEGRDFVKDQCDDL